MKSVKMNIMTGIVLAGSVLLTLNVAAKMTPVASDQRLYPYDQFSQGDDFLGFPRAYYQIDCVDKINAEYKQRKVFLVGLAKEYNCYLDSVSAQEVLTEASRLLKFLNEYDNLLTRSPVGDFTEISRVRGRIKDEKNWVQNVIIEPVKKGELIVLHTNLQKAARFIANLTLLASIGAFVGYGAYVVDQDVFNGAGLKKLIELAKIGAEYCGVAKKQTIKYCNEAYQRLQNMDRQFLNATVTKTIDYIKSVGFMFNAKVVQPVWGNLGNIAGGVSVGLVASKNYLMNKQQENQEPKKKTRRWYQISSG